MDHSRDTVIPASRETLFHKIPQVTGRYEAALHYGATPSRPNIGTLSLHGVYRPPCSAAWTLGIDLDRAASSVEHHGE